MGGGSGIKTRVELVNATSQVVIFQATGTDNEKMRRVFVDLRAFMGAKIMVRVVDEETVGWGHVNFDDFKFHTGRPIQGDEIKPAR